MEQQLWFGAIADLNQTKARPLLLMDRLSPGIPLATPPDSPADIPSPAHQLRLGLLLLSAASLSFEINLTRLFSVSQFYHFAFMIVSIALLGYGASGTVLAILPRSGPRQSQRSLCLLSLATSLSILGAYLLINQLPFDSFSIAWDTRQVYILMLQFGVLALPFFFTGMAVGLLLTDDPHNSGKTYGINLLGSALGCLLVLVGPSSFGGEGTVVLSSGMAALAALAALVASLEPRKRSNQTHSSTLIRRSNVELYVRRLVSALLLLFTLAVLISRATGNRLFSWLDLHLSPYKSLSYALQVPGAELVYQDWNSFSRVDVVRSSSIHSYPGLSYQYMKPLPAQDGLTVDGDDLLPIVNPEGNQEFTGYLPAAVAYRLRPGAQALVLEPRGGLDLLVALAQGAGQVTAVEMNPLIVSAAGDIYRDPRLQLVIESDRSYLRRGTGRFDVIVISLVSSYHPVRSGAYSLAEDYRYTVEAFQDALALLNPDGLLVVTRWLQMPPSECLRTFAIAVTALERRHGDPKTQLVALRGYNTGTILVKNSPFRDNELQEIRAFAGERAYDLNYAPGMRVEEANQYNILPEPVYYQAFSALIENGSRAAFYASYPYDVAPPTDDHPFFGHFFKWSQAGQILDELGKTWQPFGGAGYFVVIALLLLAILMAGILIILPAAVLSRDRRAGRPATLYLVYFGLIGLGFMLVEIPLIQRFILFLGHPTYAMTAVLFTLLLSSSLGSRWSSHLPLRLASGLLVVLLLAAPWLLPRIFQLTLGLPLIFRSGVTVMAIAPLGFLMGVPFPGGIQWMLGGAQQPVQVPWIWAVNGAASVISSVLAALLALSFGFDWVLRIGALSYAAAWLVVTVRIRPAPLPPPVR